ncbi:MAG TPA: VWA domain-containing protein [Candidatus Acidoferrum sp.]|nr:VWA domain-containing protein [Candidatus Acidoferrum sp.]
MTTSTQSRIGILHFWPIVLLLAASLLYAQQTPNPGKPEDAPNAASMSDSDDAPATTTFKARTDLVLVPVVVRGKHGDHIAGLNRDAFHLEENGKEQTVSLFEEVQATTNAAPPTPVLDRGYSNLPFDDTRQLRLTIIVLDLLNTTPVQRTDGKELLIKFLSKGLAHDQPVSLLCLTNKDLQLVHPFTSDTNLLIAALKKLSLGPPRVMPRRDAAEKTLKQLTEIAQGYIGIPGRKTMIFAAGDIPEPQLERGVYPTELLSAEAFQQTFKSLIDANIAVYPFEPMAWSRDPAFSNARDSYRERSSDQSLREFADATGGNRCIESNDLMKCFAEAVEDSRSYYYMLGFSVRPDDRKPGWRNLSVKVSAEHASIRARSGFYYGSPEAPGPRSAHDAEINALASPLAYSAVPMYVRVLPQASAAPADAASTLRQKTAVEFLVTIPLTSIRVDPSSPSPLDLEIGAIALTRDTREAGELLHPVRGNPKPEVLRQFARDGIKLREKLDLPPGSYDIRFMTRDNNSAQIGTVVFPLEVQ